MSNTVATLSAPQSILTGEVQQATSHQTINAESPHEFLISAQSHSQSGVQFYQSISSNVLLERCVMMEYHVTVVLNFKKNPDFTTPLLSQKYVPPGTWNVNGWTPIDTFAGNVVYPSYGDTDIGLAQLPLHRITSNMQVTLNNVSMTSTPNVYQNALAKYMINDNNKEIWSLFPCQSDKAVRPIDNSPITRTDSPLCKEGLLFRREDNSGIDQVARPEDGKADTMLHPQGFRRSMGTGNYGYGRTTCQLVDVKYSDAANTDAATMEGSLSEKMAITYHVTEPLIHPFFTGPESRDTFANISNFDVKLTFQSSILPMITQHLASFPFVVAKGANGNPATDNLNLFNKLYLHNFIEDVQIFKECTSIDATTTSYGDKVPNLRVRTYVPVVQIPPVVKMPFYDIVTRSFKVPSALSAGQTSQVQTDSIVFGQVPQRIYVFVRPDKEYGQDVTDRVLANLNGVEPDQFCGITGMTVFTDLNQGLLTSATQQQLYQMSKRNGSNQSWDEFSKNQGSIVCLDLSSSDLGAWIPGARTQFQFRMNVDVESLSHDLTLRSGDKYTLRSGATNTYERDQCSVGKLRDWRLFIVAVMSGEMTADLSTLQTATGVDAGQAQAVAAAGPTPGFAEDTEPEGGGLKSWTRKHSRKLKDVASKGAKIAAYIHKNRDMIRDNAKKVAQNLNTLNQIAKEGAQSAMGGGQMLTG